MIRAEHQVKTEIVPFVIGALGSGSKRLKTYIDVGGIPNILVVLKTLPLRAQLEFERCLESLRSAFVLRLV